MDEHDPREEFLRLYKRGAPLSHVAMNYNLTPEEIGLALHYARLTKVINKAQKTRITIGPPPPSYTNKSFCTQCDRLVRLDEGQLCQKPFCKMKVAA